MIDTAPSPDATRRSIYAYIERQGIATKRHIAVDLGLSLPTVGKYLAQFLRDGLITEKTKLASGSKGGRSPIAYAVVPGARYAIGMDVAADRVVTVVIDLQRHVLLRRRTARRYARDDAYLQFLAAEVRAVVTEAGIPTSDILGVGIAVPGLVDSSGEIFYGEALGNAGLRLAEFARVIDVPVRLFHDSDAAGRAEFWGVNDVRNAFYLSLSGSIGGSILLDGIMFAGEGVAGEVGHLTVEPGGRLCYCGRLGCLDPYCNVGVLLEVADDLEDFFTRVDVGEAGALAVWEEYTTYLSRAIHDVRTLFGCQVILGGEVGPHLRGRIDALRQKVDGLSFRHDPAVDYLHSAEYGPYPIATGAALFLIEDFKVDLGGDRGRRDSGIDSTSGSGASSGVEELKQSS